LYFNVSITSRELQTSRLSLVSAGEANVSVSGGKHLGLVSISSFYVLCPSLPLQQKGLKYPEIRQIIN